METFKLVRLNWVSYEREKHVYEDFNYASWDEIIGRVYLLKAHEAIEKQKPYADILVDFEQALLLLTKDGVSRKYYSRALADKAIVQCFLGRYDVALMTIDAALVQPKSYGYDPDWIMDNRCAIFVLTGAFEGALKQLQARLDLHPESNDLRFTMATCLLHMERYDEAVTAYEQAMAKDKNWYDDTGLKAARRGQQPDWTSL